MKYRTLIASLVVGAGSVGALKTYPACPPLSGDVTVKVPNIYPESADFALSNCRFYIGSLNNGSVVEYDPYTSKTQIIEIPGVSHNPEFFVCGIDYSHATGTIYISASARAPWWPAFGVNLTGPNRLIHYSPLENAILWQANIDTLVDEIQNQAGSSFAGFEDSAEDKDGNAYFLGAFGNIIIKVDKDGLATKFYTPEPDNDKSYGFGGAFITQDNVLVLGDAQTKAFVRFDLSGPTPSQPTFSVPSGHPEIFKKVLDCDALNAPMRYQDKVAICSNVLDRQFAPHGIITVYTSEDGWKTSEYVGMIPTELEPPDVWSTAQLATADRVYALSSSLPYDDGEFPQTESTTLVDITDKIDALVGKFAPSETLSRTGQVHEEL